MDTLRNVGDSLPKPAAHTSGIPSGLFVFGGGAGSVQQSNADDSRALDELSSMGPEFDGMARAQPRQARRMSASKASSRRRRSSSSSLSGTQPRLPTPALFVPGDGGNVNSGGGGSGNAGELTNPVFGHNQSRGIEAEDSGFGGGSSSSGSGSGTHGNPSAAAAVAVAAEEEGKSCGDDGGGEGVQERGGGEGGGGTGVKPSKGRSSWSGMDRKAALRQQQKRLLLLRHASRCACSEKGSVCQVSPDCDEVKALWKHIAHCQDKACTRPHCESSRFVLKHYSRCRHRECPLCGPVRAVIANARRQRREESNGGEAQEGEGHEDSDEDMEDFEDRDGDGDNVDDDDDDDL